MVGLPAAEGTFEPQVEHIPACQVFSFIPPRFVETGRRAVAPEMETQIKRQSENCVSDLCLTIFTLAFGFAFLKQLCVPYILTYSQNKGW